MALVSCIGVARIKSKEHSEPEDQEHESVCRILGRIGGNVKREARGRQGMVPLPQSGPGDARSVQDRRLQNVQARLHVVGPEQIARLSRSAAIVQQFPTELHLV